MESGTRNAIQLSDAVAKEIRVLLVRRDMKQTELATRMGVSEMWLSRRLRGAQPLDLNDVQRIADALNVEVVDLLPQPFGGRILTTAGHTPVEQGHNLKRESVRPPESTRPNGHPRHQTPHPSTRRPVRMSLAHKQSGD